MSLGVPYRTTGELISASIWNGDLVDSLNLIAVNTSGNQWQGKIATTLQNHGLGVTPQDHIGTWLSGTVAPAATTAAFGVAVSHTLTPRVGGSAAGVVVNPAAVRAGSGAHPVIASLHLFAPTISGAGASVSVGASLYIENAPAFGGANYGIYANGAVHVNGALTVSGALVMSSGTVQLYGTTTWYTTGAVRLGGIATDGTFDIPKMANFTWNAKSLSTIYQADSDLLVVVLMDGSATTGADTVVQTDSSSTPTTVRTKASVGTGTVSVFNSMVCPVKKGDYYRVVKTFGGTVTYTIWAVPLGAAATGG